ncbi:shaggy-related protein kinase gamma-like isoform X2 [Silurus meridionalis]|nr:shaggy-related protein kinase gamma-like isoform X2 [Silurus meridionalis]XP_046698227.1 shaggy-related protein kinase gamma-like isoform X2 [Silurus meridionalis]XP_046698228.1 shaggy-related protein kinase gamma-like isoform X2 [Silurus meridionalis]XP_046698229.1 shaggy-related protein kinase gamma-like isoform X2 [Silurus meridionalis]
METFKADVVPCFLWKAWIPDVNVVAQPQIPQYTLLFPGPLMRDTLEKNNLIEYILEAQKLCLQHIYDPHQVENYFFWQIMELSCNENGKVNMCKIAPLLFNGYSMLKKKAPELNMNLKTWCIPLVQLLYSSGLDDERREAVIMMGDDLASRGLIYAAHICYVLAKVELGSRSQFQLIGCDRIPFGLMVQEQAFIRTEMYEYILSLSSGLAQPSFQIFKLCHASRLAMYGQLDLAREYCKTIAMAALSFPDSFKRTFYNRLLSMSLKLFEGKRTKSDWLMDIWQLRDIKLADTKLNIHIYECCRNIGKNLTLKPPNPGVFHLLYTVGEALGKGHFGYVNAGVQKKDGKKVAIKYIDKKSNIRLTSVPSRMYEVPLEVALMKAVSAQPRCNNVIALLDWFDLPNHIIMVLQHPSPCLNLSDYLQLQKNPLSEAQARKIMRQVVWATRHCTARGVIHRDIKTDNLLINTETLVVKLIDFGCGDWLLDTPYTDYAGANFLMPPEFLLHGKYMGIPATIWNLGIILYNLLTGDFPIKIDNDLYFGLLNLQPDVSPECFELIMWCLELNPELRPSFEDILGHEWFECGVQDNVQIPQGTNNVNRTQAPKNRKIKKC